MKNNNAHTINSNKKTYLTPTNDYIFKKIFAKPENIDILKDFLISILEINIKKIRVKNDLELNKDTLTDKYGILDLKAKVNNMWIDIEMQIRKQEDIEKRFLYYFSKLYTQQLKSGEKYSTLQKAIVIGILDFNIYSHKHYHSKMSIKEDLTNKRYFKDFELHIIELPKYLKTLEDNNSKLAKWLSFLTRKNMEVLNMAVKTNPMIKKAEKEYQYLIGDEAEERRQELIEKKKHDDASIKAYNIEQGRKKGIKEGKAQGLKMGRIEFAIYLLSINSPLKNISKLTSLSQHEILNIKNKSKKN